MNRTGEAEVLESLEDLPENVNLPKECIDVEMFKKQISVNEKNLNIVHVNIRSIKKNFDDLLVFLQAFELYCCDILVLSECFRITGEDFNIPGYKFHYNNATYNKNDGVIIYTKNSLNVQIMDYKLSNSLVTISKITLKIQNITFGITCVYRPPSTNDVNFVRDIEDHFTNKLENQIEIFLGDTNINICDSSNNEIVSLYQSTLSRFGFSPYITCPTRVTTTTTSCIDHIYVRKKLKISSLKYQSFVLNSDLTDHYPIVLNIVIKKPHADDSVAHERKNVNVTKTDYEKLIRSLKSLNWECALSCADPESATEIFYQRFNDMYKQATHSKCIKRKVNKKLKPWITNGLINSIKKRDKLKKKVI